MTNFAKPVAQRPQNWLAQLRGLAAANAAGGTSYTVEYPKRKAGETTPDSERGVSVAITGNVETDHEGNATGLTGWGQAVKTPAGTWVNLGAKRTVGGVATAEWTVKGFETTALVTTGLTVLTAAIGQTLFGAATGTIGVEEVKGTAVRFAMRLTGEQAVGTKLDFWWIAIGE